MYFYAVPLERKVVDYSTTKAFDELPRRLARESAFPKSPTIDRASRDGYCCSGWRIIALPVDDKRATINRSSADMTFVVSSKLCVGWKPHTFSNPVVW